MKGRALVAGVGQPWMGDLAFGCHVVRRLRETGLPPGIDALDLSFGAVAALQVLQEAAYERAVFVSSRAAEHEKGRLHVRRPADLEEDDERVQARVADALMGCVSLDHLLALCQRFGALPPRTVVVEAEPESDLWDPELSPSLRALVPEAAAVALALAGEPDGGQ